MNRVGVWMKVGCPELWRARLWLNIGAENKRQIHITNTARISHLYQAVCWAIWTQETKTEFFSNQQDLDGKLLGSCYIFTNLLAGLTLYSEQAPGGLAWRSLLRELTFKRKMISSVLSSSLRSLRFPCLLSSLLSYLNETPCHACVLVHFPLICLIHLWCSNLLLCDLLKNVLVGPGLMHF